MLLIFSNFVVESKVNYKKIPCATFAQNSDKFLTSASVIQKIWSIHSAMSHGSVPSLASRISR